MKRKGISKAKRFKIFKRDQFTCVYCGRKPPVVVLELDHVIAVSNGGNDSESNLVASCFDCNRGKSDGSLDPSIMPDVAEKARISREKVEQLKAYQKALADERNYIDESVYRLGVKFFNLFALNETERGKFIFNERDSISIRTFLGSLTEFEISDAIELAVSKCPHSSARAFKYLCGICWVKIRERAQ